MLEILLGKLTLDDKTLLQVGKEYRPETLDFRIRLQLSRAGFRLWIDPLKSELNTLDGSRVIVLTEVSTWNCDLCKVTHIFHG